MSDIKSALNVCGTVVFDNDIFLLDYWDAEDGLNYLVGIADLSETDDGGSSFVVINTLDLCSYTSDEHPEIIFAFSRKLDRITKIWNSGLHAQTNPPWYYIEWALKKGFKIPWLDYAIEKGFYKPKESVSATQVKDKPLLAKERNTLLVIIAALAKEAKIDYSKPSKAATQIEAMTEKLGARVDHATIENKIKMIDDAIESRGK